MNALRRSGWWSSARPGVRLAFSSAWIIALLALLIVAVADRQGFFSAPTAWAFVVASPFLLVFLVAQARRAFRDLRR